MIIVIDLTNIGLLYLTIFFILSNKIIYLIFGDDY